MTNNKYQQTMQRSVCIWNSLPTEFRSLSVSFGDFRVRHAEDDIVRAILVHSAQ